MNPRSQFLDTLAFSNRLGPPRYESDFAEEVIHSWRSQGLLNGSSIEESFQLDHRENMPVRWNRVGQRMMVAETKAGLELFRKAYDPACSARLPENWNDLVKKWSGRDYALRASPWDEGLLQVIGIGDWSAFYRAVMLIYENPRQIEAMMELYADYLESFLDRVLKEVEIDYAVLYEVIASNHAPVISPEMVARFAIPAMKRVITCLERHGVSHRFIWTTGQVMPLLPLWLEAGINGVILTQTAASKISYLDLRREFGRELRLMGGLDSQTVVQKPDAIGKLLRHTARPLLEQGGYIPHLDDRIRSNMPFENYRAYRRQLNALIDEVYGRRR